MQFSKNILIIIFLTMTLARCGGGIGGTETGNPSTEGVNHAIANSVDSVSTNLSSEGNGLVALHVQKPSIRFYLTKFLNPINIAYAQLGTGGCSDTDPNISVTITCSDTNHEASIIKGFKSGCDAGNGIIITGKHYNSWFNMGNDSCSSSGRPKFIQAIQGLGAKQIISTDSIPPNGSCETPMTADIRHFPDGGQLQIIGWAEMDYSNFQSSPSINSVTEKLTIEKTSRIRLNSDGSKLYDHSIFTKTPLSIDLEKKSNQALPTRKIISGEVDTKHNLAKYTVHSVFSNVQYDYNICECHPVSGSVHISVTDDKTGNEIGTGSITFTAITSGICNSFEATYAGQPINLPLGTCHGI